MLRLKTNLNINVLLSKDLHSALGLTVASLKFRFKILKNTFKLDM